MPAAARVVTELEVDASKAIASLNSYDAATGKAATGSLRLIESGRGIERQLDRVRAAADPAIAATQKMERAQATVDAAFKRGLISQTEAGRVIGQLKDHYSVAGREAETFGGRIRGAGEGLKEYGESLSKYTVAFGIGSVALFGGPELIRRVRETVSSLHELGDAAGKAGISSEKLQVLRYEMEQNAGTADEADAAMVKFNKTVGELALTGQGPGKAAMDALGISVRDVAGHVRSTDVIFDEVVAKLGRVKDQSQIAAVAARLFGKEVGPALAGTLALGTVGMEDAEQHLRALGGIMGNETLEAAEKLDRKFNDLSVTLDTKFKEAAVSSGGFFLSLIDLIETTHKDIDNLWNDPSARSFLKLAFGEGNDFLGNSENLINMLAPPSPSERISQAFDNQPASDPALQRALEQKAHGTITLRDTSEADKQTKAIESLFSAYDKGTADIVANTNALGLNHEQMVSQETTMRLVNDAVSKGIQLTPELVDRINQEADARTNATLAMEDYKKAQDQAISRMDDLRDSTKGFIDTLANGGDIVDFFKKKLLDLGETQLTNALLGKPGEGGGGLFGDAFGKLFGMGSSPAPQSVTSKIGYGIPMPWATGQVTSADIPALAGGAPNGMGSQSLAAAMLRGFESFRSNPYRDNGGAYRIGYGSDTETNPLTGAISGVTAGSGSINDAWASADLARRIAAQQQQIMGQVGPNAWNALTPQEQASLTSVGYNYGTLPVGRNGMLAAIQSNNPSGIASSIQGLAGDNGGINSARRMAEAQAILDESSQKLSTSLSQVAQTAQTGASNFSVFPSTLDSILKSLGGGGGLSGDALSAIAGAGGGGLFSRVGPPGGGRVGGGGGVTINHTVQNHASGVETETRASRGAGGEINMETIVRRVTDHVGTTYGLRRQTIGRA